MLKKNFEKKNWKKNFFWKFFFENFFKFFFQNLFLKYFFRIFSENLVSLAQKMTKLFNLGTDRQTDRPTDRQTDIWIYRAPMELKILQYDEAEILKTWGLRRS